MPEIRIPGRNETAQAITLPNGDTAYMDVCATTDPAGNIIGENLINFASVTGGITTNADTALAAAGAAGIRNYLTTLWMKNTGAPASEVVIKDGASTVLWRGHLGANMTFGEPVSFNPPLKGSPATAMNFTVLTTGTATIVSAQGYTGA